MNHRSVNRRTTQSSYRPASQSSGTGFSRTKAASGGEANRTFAQDFNMEHSFSSVTVTRKKVYSSSNTAESSPSRSACADPASSNT